MANVTAESLSAYRIDVLPDSMFYIPNFITETEETTVVSSISSNRWTPLTHRRLQVQPSPLTANNVLLAKALPTWLMMPAANRITSLGIFKDAPHGINHCLINEYQPGQGIMPHEDGAAYYPVVATVSLGGTVVLDVMEKVTDDSNDKSAVPRHWRILQEPRSLLLTTGNAYTDTLHGIAEVTEDMDLQTVANWSLLGDTTNIAGHGYYNKRTTRISLTYRDVRKVWNGGSKIFGKPR